MQQLKRLYLAGDALTDQNRDPVYQEYYFHRRSSGGHIIGEERFGKIIPQYIPRITSVFWVWLASLEMVRIFVKIVQLALERGWI
jgi:hypothetical protein